MDHNDVTSAGTADAGTSSASISSMTRRCLSWPERRERRDPGSTKALDNPSFEEQLAVLDREVALHPVAGLIKQHRRSVRWDGASRSVTAWNGLKRDPALWIPQGNCFVYLYKKGESNRGPSFRIPFQALQLARCDLLLERFLAQRSPESGNSSISPGISPGKKEIYLPAPEEKDSGFPHYLASRNFFAWVLDRNLVAFPNFGGALVGLLDSMNEFRSKDEDNITAIKQYMYRKRYLDFGNRPHHALAALVFAEHFQLRDVWIDAFAHCVGLQTRLKSSPEFEHVSRISKSLIITAKFEMDRRLNSCGESLSTLLASDDAYLAFSDAAKEHLRNFRSFLEKWLIVEFGEYPPAAQDGTTWTLSQKVYKRMFASFKKLYEHLADTSDDKVSAFGGICVLQNVRAFEKRHYFNSLPYSLPLLPLPISSSTSSSSLNSRQSRRLSLKGLGKRSEGAKAEERFNIVSWLWKATNPAALDCPLVRAYRAFEEETALSDAKVDKNRFSAVERRKVRWILVYSIYQTLVSATKVAEEVRSSEDLPYSLSASAVGCPPWREEQKANELPSSNPVQPVTNEDSSTHQEQEVTSSSPSRRQSSGSLRPDIDYRRTMSSETVVPKSPKSPVLNHFPSFGSIYRRRPSITHRKSSSDEDFHSCRSESLNDHVCTTTVSSSSHVIKGFGNVLVLQGMQETAQSPTNLPSDFDGSKHGNHQFWVDLCKSVKEVNQAIPLFDETEAIPVPASECIDIARWRANIGLF